jgi:hypothetical protein
VFAHLNCTNNLKPLKSFLALGVNREAPLRSFGTINPKQDSTIDVFTPLVAAGLLDNVKLVRNLLDSGAKVQYDCYNHEDLSCYCDMDAARSEEMVDVLLEYGGDIELVDSEKWTPCRSLLSHYPSSSSTCPAKTFSSHSIAVTARHPAESGMGTPLWVGRSRRQENQQPASTLYHKFLRDRLTLSHRSHRHSSLPHRDFVTMHAGHSSSLHVEVILTVGQGWQ